MARRIINRKEKRAEFDAAERREKAEDEVDETEDEGDDDDDGEEEEGEDEEEGASGGGDDDEAGDGDGDGDDDEEAPKKKKKKPKAPAKPKAKRTRTPKITRMKVMWHVFNNSNQKVAEFDYPKRKDADELAAKLTNDKKNTHFVQPVKVSMEA